MQASQEQEEGPAGPQDEGTQGTVAGVMVSALAGVRLTTPHKL